nr:hypothetical protein CFP56_45214 [Quercus suber]
MDSDSHSYDADSPMNDGEATSESNPAYEFEAPPDASSPTAQHRKRFNFHHRKHGTSALLAHTSFGCEEYPYIHAPVDKPEVEGYQINSELAQKC